MDRLVNWIVQGLIVAAVAGACLRVVLRTRGRAATLWAALLAILLLPMVPLLWTVWQADGASGAPVPSMSPVSVPVGWWSSSMVIGGAWAAWLCASAAQSARAVGAVRRAKAGCVPFPAATEAGLRHWMQERARGRCTRLVLSSHVRSAAVLGWRAPVIAVAPALLERLTGDELDGVVIHEWAHVQRRDDFAQVVQLVVRVFVGWHPAVWWTTRALQFEREVACDRIAVAVTGSPKAYAANLAKIASLSAAARSALAAPAAVSPSNLRRRVVRILTDGRETPRNGTRAHTIAVSAMVSSVALVVGAVPFVEFDPSLTDASNPARPAMMALAVPAPSIAVQITEPPRLDRRFAPTAAARVLSKPNEASAPAASGGEAIAETPAFVQPGADATTPGVTQAIEPPLPSIATVRTADVDSAVARTLPAAKPPAPWAPVADAGVAVGRRSQQAGVATAGFFTRVGKKVAAAF